MYMYIYYGPWAVYSRASEENCKLFYRGPHTAYVNCMYVSMSLAKTPIHVSLLSLSFVGVVLTAGNVQWKKYAERRAPFDFLFKFNLMTRATNLAFLFYTNQMCFYHLHYSFNSTMCLVFRFVVAVGIVLLERNYKSDAQRKAFWAWRLFQFSSGARLSLSLPLTLW